MNRIERFYRVQDTFDDIWYWHLDEQQATQYLNRIIGMLENQIIYLRKRLYRKLLILAAIAAVYALMIWGHL